MQLTLEANPCGVHGGSAEHKILVEGTLVGYVYWRPTFPGDDVLCFYFPDEQRSPPAIRAIKRRVRYLMETNP